jgi:hypothetical protein
MNHPDIAIWHRPTLGKLEPKILNHISILQGITSVHPVAIKKGAREKRKGARWLASTGKGARPRLSIRQGHRDSSSAPTT